MKPTKMQQERINLLQGDNSYLNPIRSNDSDVFTKFEIGNLFKEPKKTGNWITLIVETKTHDHETLSAYHNHFFTKQWQIFISPRGKMFAPSFPSYLEGMKKTHCGRITLSNII